VLPRSPSATPKEARCKAAAEEHEAAALAARAQAAEAEAAELRRQWLEAEAAREEQEAALGCLQARMRGLQAQAEDWRRELCAAAEEQVRAAEAAAAERERQHLAELELLRRRLAAAESGRLGGQQPGVAAAGIQAGVAAAETQLAAARQQEAAAVGPKLSLTPLSSRQPPAQPNRGTLRLSPAATGGGLSRRRLTAGRSSPGRTLAPGAKPKDSGQAAADPVTATGEAEGPRATAGRDPNAEARPPGISGGGIRPGVPALSGRSHSLGAGHAVRVPSGSPEDLFGIFRSLGGTSCSSAGGAAAATASPMPAVRGSKGAENRPPPLGGASLPASPSASLDGVAAAGAAEDGGRQRRLAAKLCLALGSQESCSQGADGGGGTLPPAALKAAAASSASEMALLRRCQVPAALPAARLPATAREGAAFGHGSSPTAEVADARAAMLAVDDIAQYLAD
jgi:hypothetical protein